MNKPITMGEVADLTQRYGIIHVDGVEIEHVGTWKIQRPDIPHHIKDYILNDREELEQ